MGRKRGVLLKDCSAVDFEVAADYVLDRENLFLHSSTKLIELNDLAYLKYAKWQQVDALMRRFPWVIVRTSYYPIYDPQGLSQKICFQPEVVEGILTFLVTQPFRYWRRMSVHCGVVDHTDWNQKKQWANDILNCYLARSRHFPNPYFPA